MLLILGVQDGALLCVFQPRITVHRRPRTQRQALSPSPRPCRSSLIWTVGQRVWDTQLTPAGAVAVLATHTLRPFEPVENG